MNTAYPLFPISILVILFYSLSYSFMKIGLVNRSDHRKFWNVLLLIAFLTTGLIGLFMVVKINYKLVVPIYDQLVGYHAGFGIGMAVIGIFHFWWHLNYYLHLFKGEKSGESLQNVLSEKNMDGQHLKISAFLLGSTTFMAQIILLREFLAVFNGNELVIGLVLTNWMVLTGIGAYLGKYQIRIKKTYPVIVSGILILSVLPFITTFLVNFLKNIVFPIGAMIGVLQIYFASLLLLIPFCLLSGFLFAYIAAGYSSIRDQNETGPVYGFESAGSMVGGLLCGMLFIFVFSSIESLLAIAIFNGLIMLIINTKQIVGKLFWLPLLVIVPAIVLLFFHPEKRIRSWVYPNQEIEVSKDTPFGNIVITKQENMWSVYNNNVLLFDSENFMLNEEAVHFPMLQHPTPSTVLLVSAGFAGQIAELRKYENISVDYVEDNQWLCSLMKDSLKKMTGESVKVYTIDPLRFIRNTNKKYDVAILNLPGPSTMQSNRFYTIEFFSLLREKLTRGAVLSFGLSSPANYLNDEAVELNSTIFATLKKVFQNVLIVPGEKNFFLASDSLLTCNIAKAAQEKGINNRYVNQFYINDSLLKSRSRTILSAINQASGINKDLKPLLYHQQLAYWLSYFKGNYRILVIIALLLALLVFLKGDNASKAMFLTGFSATGLEILLLFGLQVFFGNIYLLTGFIFTGFMFGLAAGSFFGKSLKSSPEKEYVPHIQLLICVFSVCTGLFLFTPAMSGLAPAIVYSLYLTAAVLIGGLTGMQFSQVSLVRTGSYAEISGKTYSYDLFGSAVGALVITLYLVPKLGIVASVYAIAIINFVFGMWLLFKKARF
jgi:spermidine synthase